MRVACFFLLFFLSSCAFVSGIKEAKNTPPAPASTETATDVNATPPIATAPIKTNTPTTNAAKAISPARF